MNRTATEWLVARFIGATPAEDNDSFGRLVDEHFPDDMAMHHLSRIVRGADAPERFDLMPESAGLRAFVDGLLSAPGGETAISERAACVFDALLAVIRSRIAAGEPVESHPFLDRVSGLPNRLLFMDRLTQAIAFAHRHDTLLAICSIRLDLSEVADDIQRVTREVADRLQHTIRQIDTIARLGINEFGVIITDVREREHADVAIAKISEILAEPFDIGDRTYAVASRTGVSFYPAHGHDAEMLVDAAREAARAGEPISVFGEST